MSFAFGISLVALLNYIYITKQTPESIVENQPIKKGVEGIKLDFIKFTESKNGIAAQYEITNLTDQSYYFRIWKGDESALTEYKIDGVKDDRFRCERGVKTIEIGPYETRTIVTSELSDYWKKGKTLEVGFSFANSPKDIQTVWSKSLDIPKEIEKKLIAEQKENILNR
ncbi:MAG TPA: hypothetical protein PKY59_24690 [Pyrinomonadaceae bacterium]|nr:hypothetical protein [Pyrinomonadaceae bacterium]